MSRLVSGTTFFFLLPLLHPLIGLAADAGWSGKTSITLAAPLRIPGAHRADLGVLPAGSYVFSIIDAQPDRHICQISNAAGTEVLATMMAMPNYRLRATDRAILLFSDALSGQQEALLAWFYPGPNWGEEVVYDKATAAELARVANRPVLFTTLDMARLTNPQAPGVLQQMRTAPIAAVKPSGEEVDFTQVVTTPPANSELAPWSAGVTPSKSAEPASITPEPPLPANPLPLRVIVLFAAVTLVAIVIVAVVVIRLA